MNESPQYSALNAQIDRFAAAMLVERAHQANRFGGGDQDQLNSQDDQYNTPSEWVTYIAKYATGWLPGHLPPFNSVELLNKFRTSMVKVATIAFSAAMWADRRIEQERAATVASQDTI